MLARILLQIYACREKIRYVLAANCCSMSRWRLFFLGTNPVVQTDTQKCNKNLINEQIISCHDSHRFVQFSKRILPSVFLIGRILAICTSALWVHLFMCFLTEMELSLYIFILFYLSYKRVFIFMTFKMEYDAQIKAQDI